MPLSKRQRQKRDLRNEERSAAINRVRRNPHCFRDLPLEYQDDDQFAWLAVVNGNGNAIIDFSNRLKKNRRLVREALKNGGGFWVVSSIFNDDYELVMIAVRANGYALGHASARLQACYDVVLAAVNQCGTALSYASAELQADYRVVMAAVTMNGIALRDASRELQANNDVVTKAVTMNGMALQFASDELRANEEIVDAATMQDRRALQYSLVQDAPLLTFASLDDICEDTYTSPELPPELSAEQFAQLVGLD